MIELILIPIVVGLVALWAYYETKDNNGPTLSS